MFWYSFKAQFCEMIRKKTTVFTFFLVLIMSLINFYANMVVNYQTRDITQMYDVIKCLMLSDWSISGAYLIEFFPLIVVIPTACAYLTDRDTRMTVYIESRVGKKNYWYSKLLAVFVTTFLVFVIPFVLEIAISLISFGSEPSGDLTNSNFVFMMENEEEYFLNKLYLNNKVFYAVVTTVIFGIISGIFAMFNFAMVTLPFFKYKVFAFFPMYVLIYVISFIEKVLNKPYTLNYYFILRTFCDANYNYIVYVTFLLILIIVSIILIELKIKKEDII